MDFLYKIAPALIVALFIFYMNRVQSKRDKADEGKLLIFDGNFSKEVIVPEGMPDWEEITDEGQMNVVINPEI